MTKGNPMPDRKRILVTPRSLTRAPHPATELLRSEGFEIVTARPGEQPTEAELHELLPGCVGFLAGAERISATVLRSAPGLVAISRNGVGTDGIDRATAAELGVQVLTTPGANAQSVAELTAGLMLALARSIPYSDSVIKAGGWDRRIGRELTGATLGVIGCGAIGRRVTSLALALGMEVIGYDPAPADGFSPNGFAWADQSDLLRGSDVVSLHSPATAKPILDAHTIGLMKEGAYLVNTARASLVDTDAVLHALDEGLIAGYAVDAYEVEPPTDRRLVEHSRVIATPHIGGYTGESVYRAAMGAAQNLLQTLREERNG